MNAIHLFACNRSGYGWVEGDDWVEDEDAAESGTAVTSDDLPDICFFGGGEATVGSQPTASLR